MKTAYKFVLRAYAGPMILTFFIVMFILLMHTLWQLIDELVGKGLSLSVIIELVMYASATLIPMGLPLATLLASIMTMGNMGENYELLALKSAGISLPRIMKPLIILMFFVSVGSFFVINNLTPYCFEQMMSLRSDISKQKQEMKFQDGIFFNGIPDMSIRIGHQEPSSKLNDVLIYNSSNSEKMQTTVADSGYIRITDDRKFLHVKLFNGEMYEKNRDYQWYTRDTLTHHIFDKQEMFIPLSGFAFERADNDQVGTRSETKSMRQLGFIIDSLKIAKDSVINNFVTTLSKSYVFKHYYSQGPMDSLSMMDNKIAMPLIVQNVDTMNVVNKKAVFTFVKQWANDAQTFVAYKTSSTKFTSTKYYVANLEYQRKIALPFSIMIFFLIGAPLGAIIRKGGIGMPIVVSVAFFVVYYIISIMGEKFVKDGAIPAYVGMWISSYLLFPLAIFLTYKATNDSKLFNADAYKNSLGKIKRFALTFTNKIINKTK